MDEKRERKLSVLRFLANWREFIKGNRPQYAEAYFMGGWSTNDDDWCVEALHQMTREELSIIMEYPIWL